MDQVSERGRCFQDAVGASDRSEEQKCEGIVRSGFEIRTGPQYGTGKREHCFPVAGAGWTGLRKSKKM